jgi:hypothetical protein
MIEGQTVKIELNHEKNGNPSETISLLNSNAVLKLKLLRE